MSDSLQPHGLSSPWNSPGQNTGVGSLSLLEGDLPNPGIEPRSPTLQADSLPAEISGKLFGYQQIFKDLSWREWQLAYVKSGLSLYHYFAHKPLVNKS